MLAPYETETPVGPAQITLVSASLAGTPRVMLRSATPGLSDLLAVFEHPCARWLMVTSGFGECDLFAWDVHLMAEPKPVPASLGAWLDEAVAGELP